MKTKSYSKSNGNVKASYTKVLENMNAMEMESFLNPAAWFEN